MAATRSNTNHFRRSYRIAGGGTKKSYLILTVKKIVFDVAGRHATGYAALVERFEGSDDPATALRVAQAMNNAGVAMRKVGDVGAAIAMHDAVMERNKGAEDPDLAKQTAYAAMEKAMALHRGGEREAAKTQFTEVAATYAGHAEKDLKDMATTAGRMARKVDALLKADYRPDNSFAWFKFVPLLIVVGILLRRRFADR